jgi:hypothetical protein
VFRQEHGSNRRRIGGPTRASKQGLNGEGGYPGRQAAAFPHLWDPSFLDLVHVDGRRDETEINRARWYRVTARTCSVRWRFPCTDATRSRQSPARPASERQVIKQLHYRLAPNLYKNPSNLRSKPNVKWIIRERSANRVSQAQYLPPGCWEVRVWVRGSRGVFRWL